MRANRGDCLLLVIDVQSKLIDTIFHNKQLVENIEALVKTAKVLALDIVVTEQEKLGQTVPELDRELSRIPKFSKLVFSCFGSPDFEAKLRELSRRTVIVCGIEAHICVLQTVLDLIDRGYQVLLPVDATSSYASLDSQTAIERMRDAGATITTTEALIYELTERAGTDEFRRILEIVKERRRAVLPRAPNSSGHPMH